MKSKVICVVFVLLMIFSFASSTQIVSSEPEEAKAILWYGWQDYLVCIKLDADGLKVDFIESPLLQDTGDPMPNTDFLSMTMLEDGSLIYTTQESNPHPFISKFFHIQDPKSDGSTSYAKYIGTMPEGIGVEALYTDSQNRIYVMDTGVQHSSSQGNRLLRFTGDVTAGDFGYDVIKSFSIPDIDGMGPGIDKTSGWVVDNPGYAIDSYSLHEVNYETGDFTYINTNVGPYDIHAINGSFFEDGRSRLYVNTGTPQAGSTETSLFEIDPVTGGVLQFLGKGPAGMGLTGSLAERPPDEPDDNEPPVADAGEDQVVYEGEDVAFDGLGSSDPDGTIQDFQWDFDASDGLWWDTGNTPDATGPSPVFTYGDDGVFIVTLRVKDNENELGKDTCNITVLNVDPNIFIEGVTMEVEIGLRVAGRKYNDVGMTLSENEKIIGYVSIERMPGSPDYQMAWIPVTMNLSRTYSTVVTYTPEDPPKIGANPTWVYIRFPNGSIHKIHHTFNVQQSKKRDSNHWNHVEPWEVDVNAHLIGWAFDVNYHVSDPGSDDEILTFTYCSQNEMTTHLNSPPNIDPYTSPDINPRDIFGTKSLIYEGPGTLTVKVEDDDGGENQRSVDIV